MFFIVDHAAKMCWVYPLNTSESKFILSHLTIFVNEVLPSLNIRLRHFHSDDPSRDGMFCIMSTPADIRAPGDRPSSRSRTGGKAI